MSARVAGDLDGGGAGGAVGRRRLGERHREAGVVDLGVEIADPAGHGVLAQRGHGTQAAGARQVPVAWHRRVEPGEPVVEQEARAHERTVPGSALEREQQRHGVDEVRRELLREQPALMERLAHEADVELLEVAQPSVDELARPARRAGGEVALLDQRHGEAAAGRIQGGATPRHAAADHEDVEFLCGQPLQQPLPALQRRRPAAAAGAGIGTCHRVSLEDMPAGDPPLDPPARAVAWYVPACWYVP